MKTHAPSIHRGNFGGSEWCGGGKGVWVKRKRSRKRTLSRWTATACWLHCLMARG